MIALKMADQGRSDSSFYHESLRTWIKTIANKFAISNHTALKLDAHALRSDLKLTREYELFLTKLEIAITTQTPPHVSWEYKLDCVVHKFISLIYTKVFDMMLFFV